MPATALLMCVVGTLWQGAAAQGPSPDQVAEIRRNCRSDYIRHCSDVPPGGQPAFACLMRNEAQLSNACRQSVEAVAAHAPGAAPPVSPAPAGSTAPPATSLRGMSLMEACGADYRANCRAVPPGGGRALGCLLDHHASLSTSCRGALEAGRRRL